MAGLDLDYVSALLTDAERGNNASFAELYAATYQKQYRFAFAYLRDEFSAQEALQEAYVFALTNLSLISDASLFVPWICRATFRACLKIRYPASGQTDPETMNVRIGKRNYTLRQLLLLPLSVSQVLVFRHFCGLSIHTIASLTETSFFSVCSACRKGRKQLSKAGEFS